MNCTKCKAKRSMKLVEKGRLKYDPDHPGEHDWKFREVTHICTKCGHTNTSHEYPFLLNDLFNL